MVILKKKRKKKRPAVKNNTEEHECGGSGEASGLGPGFVVSIVKQLHNWR